MDFFNFVAWVGLGIVILVFGWVVFVSVALKAIESRSAQRAQQQNQPIPLTVEEIGGTLYSWHAETHDFVCQGSSLADLRSNFKLRYPDKNAHIAKGSESLLTRLRADLKLLKQNETVSQ